jgi:CRP-like cAMP-binding protein
MATSQYPILAASRAADLLKSLAGTAFAPFADLFGEARCVEAGHQLFQQGRSRTHLLVLLSGWAYAYRSLSDGRQHVIEIYVPGDVIGLAEAWKGTSDSGVVTLTEARVAPLARADIAALAGRCSQAREFLLTTLADTAMALSLRSTSLARHTAYERVATLLWSLRARTQPLDGDDTSDSFFCPVSQGVMADVLGLSIVHVNRSLSQLARDGVLRKKSKQVEVLDDGAWRSIVLI